MIPRIRSPGFDYNKHYYVKYNQKVARTAQDYYALDKFQLVPEEDKFREQIPGGIEMLSYCSTCQILRPPRSFHCRICDVCIEVHDHHCPYVGTCVAKRNMRYFVGFLANAALLCLVSCIFCIISYANSGISMMNDSAKNEDGYTATLVTFVLMIYTGVMTISVGSFAIQNN